MNSDIVSGSKTPGRSRLRGIVDAEILRLSSEVLVRIIDRAAGVGMDVALRHGEVMHGEVMHGETLEARLANLPSLWLPPGSRWTGTRSSDPPFVSGGDLSFKKSPFLNSFAFIDEEPVLAFGARMPAKPSGQRMAEASRSA